MKSNQVFISYKKEDIKLAEQFHLELEKHHISSWIDRQKLSKEVSQDYIDIIHQKIKESSVLLLLYSEKVNHSDFIIHEEVEYALKHQLPVFCFLLDNSEMCPELKQMIGNKQWICNFQELGSMESCYLNESVHDEWRRNYLKSLITDKIVPTDSNANYTDINLFLMRIAIQRYFNILTPFGSYTQLEQSDSVYSKEHLTIDVVQESLFLDIPEEKRQRLMDLGFLARNGYGNIEPELVSFIQDCDCQTLKSELLMFIRENYPEIANPECFVKEAAAETADTFIHEIEQGGKRFNGLMLGVRDAFTNRTPNDEKHTLHLDMYVSDYFTFKVTVNLYHKLRTLSNKFDIKHIHQIKEYAPFLSSLGMGGYVVVDYQKEQYLLWTKRSGTISSGDMWHFSFDETVSFLKDIVRDEQGKPQLFHGRLRIDPYANFYRGLREELGFKPDMFDLSQTGIFEIGIINSDRLEIELLSYATYRAHSAAGLEEQLFPITESAIDGKYETEKIKYVRIQDCAHEFVGNLLTPEAHALYMRIQEKIENHSLRYYGAHVFVHRDAEVGEEVVFDPYVYISKGCKVGNQCKIHQYVFLDEDVMIGNRVKIQNHNNLYHGLTVDDGVFIGPNVTFTNDKHPRSINPDGTLKDSSNWVCSRTHIGYGASLCAGCVVVCGITVGKWAMVGAGCVVSKNVPDHALMVGNPARQIGWVDASGHRLSFRRFTEDGDACMWSASEEKEYVICAEDYKQCMIDANRQE